MKKIPGILMVLMMIAVLQSCNTDKEMLSTSKIIVTSESGDVMVQKENVVFSEGDASGVSISINPVEKRQTLIGIGSSFTEASAFVLAHLSPSERNEVMKKIFAEEGANFPIARTHIGACDFCVDGKYSYLDKKGDTTLESFSLAHDKEGFSKDQYQNIIDESYDLLPMIQEALKIKEQQEDTTLNIVASAWTAPAWMKDIETWYIKGTNENGWQGTGGHLKPEYEETYADYLIKYLKEYENEGVNIWGLTPVNEPHGNSGQWESMHFTPETQRDFIKQYLGPKLVNGGEEDIKLLIFDQNRDGVEHWTDVILGDEEAAEYVYGTAVHWYESTHKVYEDVLDRVNKKFPTKGIIHTEGCIDDLGKPAPLGVGDPEGFQEKDWFMNDAFWWNKNATDWGYTAPWPGVDPDEHPMYTPVHRYARNIIVSIDHWMQGWIDWNVVLDHNGGPNHVGNFCGAPIMINTETKDIYYTPVYNVLAQLSKTIRPGDVAVKTNIDLNGLDQDALHTCATINENNLLSIQILNTTKSPIATNLVIMGQVANVTVDANALQTIQIQL